MAACKFGFFACVATVSLAWSNAALPEEGHVKATEHQEVEDGLDGLVNISELLELDDGKEALTYSGDDPASVSSNRGIILRYMPKYDLAICACGKCGSTSLWGWLYKNEFGHDFHVSDSDAHGSVQDVVEDAWEGRFLVLMGKKGQDGVFKKSKTFAFVRDPKERLVSSWKSKVACAADRSNYGTNLRPREHLVESLCALAGPESTIFVRETKVKTSEWRSQNESKCMELEEFLETLLVIHKQGKAHLLNSHFMPQDMACFARKGPEQWTQVNDISSPEAYTQLATAMNVGSLPENTHSSTAKVEITEKVASLLDAITKDEYSMLGSYLTSESRVKPGASI